MAITNYKDLIVWQRAVQLSVVVYECTRAYPSDERFGLVSQMRRSAVSIPSNIAEGRLRGSRKDFLRFLRIAYASAAELETQIIISKQLQECSQISFVESELLLLEVQKMLGTMIRNMNPSPSGKSLRS